jgi:hypothetical protein
MPHDISLRRVSTSLLEKNFGVARMYAGVHQTMSEILKTMEIDHDVKFLSSQRDVKTRRFSYSETVRSYKYIFGICSNVCAQTQVFLGFLGIPALRPESILSMTDDKLHQTAGSLISDLPLSWATTNFTTMNSGKRRSFAQELDGACPSSRRLVITLKSVVRKARDNPVSNPIEEHLTGLLGKHAWILTAELKMLIGQVCETIHLLFEGPRPLGLCTKNRMFYWIEAN